MIREERLREHKEQLQKHKERVRKHKERVQRRKEALLNGQEPEINPEEALLQRKGRLLQVIRAPHVSEKATGALEKANTVVLKVAKDATKAEIKAAVEILFSHEKTKVEVEAVNTLIVKGKTKRHGQRIGRRSDWKKAYITLKEGQNLDFIGGAE